MRLRSSPSSSLTPPAAQSRPSTPGRLGHRPTDGKELADGIPGFETFDFEEGGIRHPVFCRGDGPGVVLMHELPGMTDPSIRLAERIAERDFRVYMPLLFGQPGQRAPLRNLARVCVSREFRIFAARRSSPVVDWLRTLAREAHADCGGPGVGAIGMCLTGNFALGLMVDEHLLAPVASQPSLPLGFGREALAIDPGDLERVKERAQAGARLLGLRFSEDRICPAARFDRLREELGEAFEAIEIDSSEGNPHGIGKSAHSVLTDDLVDREGHPTLEALERVFAFLDHHLRGEPKKANGGGGGRGGDDGW